MGQEKGVLNSMDHARNDSSHCGESILAPGAISEFPLRPVFNRRFVAVIDHAIVISEEAASRIDTRLKQAVLAEIAELHLDGEILLTFANIEGGREICVQRIRT